MAVTTTNTNKPINPRGDDKSPLAFNRAKIYSGKALDFDGVNDSVDLDGFTMSGNTGTFTFNFYSETNNSFRYLFDAEGSRRFIIGLGNVAGEIQLYDGAFKSVFVPKQNTWINFVVSVNGTIASCYVNGKHEIDVTISPIDLSSTTNVAVGSRSDGTTSFWSGKIAGFKIFNTALTAAQVLELYNNPEKIVPTGVSNDALKLWLPMMEGAGTTAYDGSGNGNHGTISGATWTHGVGAPVAQTAVIDWNKGTNLIAYSTALQGNWILSGGTWTSGQDDPIGGTNAYKITATNNDPYLIQNATSGISGTQYTAKCWVKGDAGREARLWVIRDNAEFRYEDFTLTGNWQEIETTPTAFGTTPVSFVSFRLDAPNDTPVAGDVSYIFAPRLVDGDNADVYVPTLSTAQTSPVLLPQGLTSGRDITGVNLFENVRKQYALNLDGQSWAEVHDNESLDFGTGSFSLEAWARVNYVNQGSAFNVILGLGGNASDAGRTFLYYNGTFNIAAFTYSNNSSASLTQTIGDWVHLVGSYDGTNATLYLNGVQVDQDARTAVDMTNDLVKMIGRDITAVRYYNDQIAQPRIYNRALTADEVEQNYNAGKNTYS